MTALESTPDEPRTRHSGMAVAVLFFVNGMTFSNWLPRIPEVRDRLGLGNAGLGATLLGGGLGGIVGSLLVARASERLGSKRLLVAAAGALAIGLPLIGFAPSAVVLLFVLTALGVLDVFNDVAMNAQGVIVQDRIQRSIMNRLHAMWSLGFTAGAVLGSTASAAGVGVRVHLSVVGAVLLCTVLVVQRWLIPVDPPHDIAPAVDTPEAGPRRRISPIVVVMAFAALGAAALEVTPNDWAAVMLRDVFDAGKVSGFGTVACAGAMLVGRLGGDHVLDRVGERRLLVGALSLCGAGSLITIVAPVTAIALVGLVVWGLGLSVVFPQLYATAARLPGTTAGAGLGSMLLGQRMGGMLTAVSVGALAEWQDLRVAFAIVSGTALLILTVTIRRMTAATR
jgi:predicted MFS family arabinose efflux permease